MTPRTALALVLVLAACGGAGGTASGAVAGERLAVADAVFVSDLEVALGPQKFTIPLAVFLGDAENACGRAKDNKLAKGAASLQMSLVRHDGRGSFLPVTPGEYTVIRDFPEDVTTLPLRAALASFRKNDEACANALAREQSVAAAGKVILRNVKPEDGGFAGGSFDLLVGDQGDRLRGDFTAAFCDLRAADTLPACE